MFAYRDTTNNKTMKNFKFTISGQKYEVEIQKHEGSVITLGVNGSQYSVEINSDGTTSASVPASKVAATNKTAAPTVKGGASVVKAPLPGNISKINIKVGDAVAKGQKLMIMEAMKMENDILCEKPGTIKNILVNEGDAVLQGDALIELE